MPELQFDPGGPLRWELQTGDEAHTLQRSKGKGKVLEMEDVHFHLNSAVLLPDNEDCKEATDSGASEDRITGLVVVQVVLQQAEANPDLKLLVAGHTDTSGQDDYNLHLSDLRAKNVLAFLTADRDGWVDLCLQKNKVEDYQRIMKWTAAQRGWDCDPGAVDDQSGPKTRAAVRGFQEEYNTDFDASIDVDGIIGKQTWGAIYDVYSEALAELMQTDVEDLDQKRGSLNAIRPASIGCGEVYPIEDDRKSDYRSEVNRRVEVIFFDPGEEPTPQGGQGDCGLCGLLYTKGSWEFEHIPCDPVTPPTLLKAYLKLSYKGPDGTQLPFPKNFPVRVKYDNQTQQLRKTKDDGLLVFAVRRTGQAFTLDFTTEDPLYLAHNKEESKTKLCSAGELGGLDEKWSWFRFPRTWSMETASWTVSGADTWDDGAKKIAQLDQDGTTIGSESSPATLELDVTWQYLQFTYYDRQAKKQDAIPYELKVSGFLDKDDHNEADPEAEALWIGESSQALPWIVAPTADKEPQLMFRTDFGTFIKTEDDGARTIETGLSLFDPGPNRLRYYDLPMVWRSTGWWARISGGSPDADPSEQGLFKDFALKETTDAKPMMFCLDDMVLCDDKLKTENWKADGTTPNRIALFCNTFRDDGGSPDDAKLNPHGLFEIDTANKQEFFTKDPTDITDRNYIATYPRWTRLLVRGGNLYDVFASRTSEGNEVVGARAAIRYVDAPAAVAVGTKVGDTSPARVDMAFFSVQPFHQQLHCYSRSYSRPQGHTLPNGACQEWSSPFPLKPSGWSNAHTCGRSDMALLRCCEVDADDGKEVAVHLQYLRLCFDFAPTATGWTAGWTPTTLAATHHNAFVNAACKNPPDRWNGADTTYGHPALFEPQDDTLEFRIKAKLFYQALDKAQAHFEIGIYDPGGRAFMSNKGVGALTLTGNPGAWGAAAGRADVDATPGAWYTLAHELGHGASHFDEYNEQWTKCSAKLRSFMTWIPGDPYIRDEHGMMVGNRDLRSRYFWHGAEWCRMATQVPLRVKQKFLNGGAGAPADHLFQLPAHPNPTPDRTYLNWPIYSRTPLQNGTRGKCHLFLYPLGKDNYAYELNPTFTAGDKPFDGILVVHVKIRWRLTKTTMPIPFNTIRSTLNLVKTSVDKTFNNKFYATGFTLGPHEFKRCLLQFEPRFLVETYPHDNDGYLTDCGITVPTAEPARTNFLTGPLAAAEGTAGSWLNKCKAVEDYHPRDFFVNADEAIAAGSSAWASNSGATRYTLNLSLNDNLEADFYKWYGDMLGLDLTTPESWWQRLNPFRNGPSMKQKLTDGILRKITSDGSIKTI